MGIVPDFIDGLQPYQPGKPTEELERERGITDAVKLASNENLLGPSPKAVEAIRAHLNELHFYPDGGCFYLREALAGELRVRPDEIVVGNGSNEVIELIIRTLVHGDDEVVYAWPSFAMYRVIAASLNVRHHEVPLVDYVHDVRGMLACVNRRTKVLIIANPNNPTGTLLPKTDFLHLIEDLPAHVQLLADEAYFEYITDPDYPNAIALRAAHPNLVVVRTFSKIYGLAGLRIGYGVMDAAVAEYVNRVRAPFNVNRMAQIAAVAALGDVEHVGRSVAMVRQGRETLTREFDRLGIRYVPSKANFLLVETPIPAAEAYDRLLDEGIIVRPMAGFGLPDHIRVTVGTPEQNSRFLRAMARLAARR